MPLDRPPPALPPIVLRAVPGADDVLTPEAGLGGFVELRRGWRLVLSGSVTFLPSELTDSPIVDEDRVWSAFAALNRVF